MGVGFSRGMPRTCTFCKLPSAKVRFLVMADGTGICDECALECVPSAGGARSHLVRSRMSNPNTLLPPSTVISPHANPYTRFLPRVSRRCFCPDAGC